MDFYNIYRGVEYMHLGLVSRVNEFDFELSELEMPVGSLNEDDMA